MTGIDIADDAVMRGFPPPPEHRLRLDQVLTEPRLTHWYVRHVRELSGTADVSSRCAPVVELPQEPMRLDAVKVGRADGQSWTLADMLAETYVDGIVVLRRGRMVYERHFYGMSPDTAHLCMSVTKSLGSCVAANLVEEGRLHLDDEVEAVVPELARSAYADATVRHLLDMSVGIRYVDELDREEYEGARLCRLEGVQPSVTDDEPGSTYAFATTTQKQGEHGAVFHYVSLNTLVLGWVMERATGTSIPDLIKAHVWSKLGTEHDAYIALDGAGSAQLEGGLCCSLRDLARFGQMLCQGGLWGEQQVVPAWWLEDVRHNGDKAAFAAAAEEWVGGRSWGGSSYRSGFWVCEFDDHISFSAAGWLGQRVYVNQEAGVVVAMFACRPPELDDELGAHVFQACEDLSRILA